MLFAINIRNVIVHQIVPALKAILGIHSHHANQNVLKIMTVQQIVNAKLKSVSTLAQDFVVTILFAQFQTMFQVVIVLKVMCILKS
jgi:hypothetical protein